MPPKQYQGNCHCGLIKYTCTLPDALAPEGEGKINRCNCSICTKNGYFLVYPKVADLQWENGSDKKMKEYWMGNKRFPHRFCPDCSSSVMIGFDAVDQDTLPEGFPHKGKVAMNAALFKDIDLENASYNNFPGRDRLGPKYEHYSN